MWHPGVGRDELPRICHCGKGNGGAKAHEEERRSTSSRRGYYKKKSPGTREGGETGVQTSASELGRA